MAYAEFYAAAKRTAKSRVVREFMAKMGERARTFNQLSAKFTEQIAANRKRREGKAPKLTAAGREMLKDAEDAAREAAAQAPQLAARLSDEELLKFVVDDWQMEADLHEPSVYHANDRAMAGRLARYIADSITLAKKRLQERGLTERKAPERRVGGLSFNVAFRRAVPGIGKLSGDCAAIEPVLETLDKILIEAGQTPLSDFVHSDPEKLTNAKAPWFDAAQGLASVRLLLRKLKRPYKKLKSRGDVVQDLVTMEWWLMEAEQRNVPFHFVVLD